MSDYSKAVIYIITTGDDFYVGSAVDLERRETEHKSRIFNENNEGYNFKYCKKIRENNGDWNIEIYKHFPCNNQRELEQEEQRVMDELNPTLNKKKAYQTEENRKEYKKLWCRKRNATGYAKNYYIENKEKISKKLGEKITCECGCIIARSSVSNHRKTPKHIKLMAEINLNK